MSQQKCPVCGDPFELRRAAKSQGTPTCSKPRCRKTKQRMGQTWEQWVHHADPKPTDFSAAFVTPDEQPAEAPRARDAEACRLAKKAVEAVNDFKRAVGCDINSLARRVIAKVPAKKQESDSIEARLSRLEAAMKQFSKKPKEKGGQGK